MSKAQTAPQYKRPIPERNTAPNKANLIRFSRLWELAGVNPNFKEKNYHEGLIQLLNSHEVSDEDQKKYLPSLAELMTTLRDVKLQKIAFLELRAFDETISRDAYDDAIVNIFTRLNTAERTLTREEITFAWLKVGWKPEYTFGRSAQECFKILRADLKARDLELDIDDLVSGVSFIWAATYNGGRVLTNRDLLQGDIIRPMAALLSEEWELLASTVGNVAQIMKDRELMKGKLFTSVNALAVFWAAHFQFKRRAARLASGELNKDSLQKIADRLVNLYLDRWLVGSSWAQRWASSSGKVLPGYALTIAGDAQAYSDASKVEECAAIHEKCLKALIADVQNDAELHVNSRLEVEAREQVSQYFGALWLWHRLDETRWKASSVSLRIGKAKEDLDVDHLVSVKIWNSKQLTEDLLPEDENVGEIINSLGNCALLQKSFNIIKSGNPLRTFMNKVHEFKDKPEEMDKWASDLEITKNHLDGDKADIAQLVTDVQNREQQIRSDLVRFIRGDLQRADI